MSNVWRTQYTAGGRYLPFSLIPPHWICCCLLYLQLAIRHAVGLVCSPQKGPPQQFCLPKIYFSWPGRTCSYSGKYAVWTKTESSCLNTVLAEHLWNKQHSAWQQTVLKISFSNTETTQQDNATTEANYLGACYSSWISFCHWEIQTSSSSTIIFRSATLWSTTLMKKFRGRLGKMGTPSLTRSFVRNVKNTVHHKHTRTILS